MQVRAEVMATLRACGGAELATAIESGISDSLVDRDYFIRLAVELHGGRHPLALSLLRHDSPSIRESTLRGFLTDTWKNHEYLDVLAPFHLQN